MDSQPAPRDVALVVLDGEDGAVELDADEAGALMSMTSDLAEAKVSACPACRSCVVACVAVVDVLRQVGAHPREFDLVTLAEEAPTLHLYVVDVQTSCRHEGWIDPGHDEWAEVVGA